MTTFASLGLAEPIQRALAELGHETPTAIQAEALPVALAGHDLIACAQTGSGKTAVFALPWLHAIAADPPRGRHPVALVLVPTRELAIQVADAFQAYGRHLRFRVGAVYGGVGYGAQLQALSRGVDVLVATPGRLIDHLERGTARLDGVRYLVLDEADRMLDLGFLPQVRRVIDEGRVPRTGRQTLLFSATMPEQIARLAADYLDHPRRVEAHAPMTTVERIDQRFYPVAQDQKAQLLAHLLDAERVESALVFARTRHRANKLSKVLDRAGLANAALHSDVPQNKRERILGEFRRGGLKLLVATDVASRGLDIPHLSHVINFDVPSAAEDYVHRIGRTGRAGREGVAITLYSNTDEALWEAVEKLTGEKLPPTRVPGFPYIVDDSEPELTRRQRAERNRSAQRPPRQRGRGAAPVAAGGRSGGHPATVNGGRPGPGDAGRPATTGPSDNRRYGGPGPGGSGAANGGRPTGGTGRPAGGPAGNGGGRPGGRPAGSGGRPGAGSGSGWGGGGRRGQGQGGPSRGRRQGAA